MNELVLNVRQIMEYPLKGEASSADAVLLQTGALGGPYAYTTAYGLVVGALDWPGSQLGVGIPLPGDAVDTGVISTRLITPPGCNQGWNFYLNAAGSDVLLASGSAMRWCFDGINALTLTASVGAIPGQPINWFETLSIDDTGYMVLANTLRVSNDPVQPLEVVTKQYADAIIPSFYIDLQNLGPPYNGQLGVGVAIPSNALGAGVLSNAFNTTFGAGPGWNFYSTSLDGLTDAYLSDGAAAAITFDGVALAYEWAPPGLAGQPIAGFTQLMRLGENGNLHMLQGTVRVAFDPVDATEVATKRYVDNEIAFLAANVVDSFNGRTGPVILTLGDVLAAGGAPIISPNFGGSPLAPTPVSTAINGEIATAAFVRRAVDALEDTIRPDIDRIVIVATSPPHNPRVGDLWWDSSTSLHGGALYIWYVDGGHGSWVVANSQEGAQGPQGPPGSSILGEFDTLAELEAAFPIGNVGDAYLVQGEMYVWSGPEQRWIPVGNLRGPAGPAGPVGPAGPPIHIGPFTPIGAGPGEGWFRTTDRTLHFHVGVLWEEIGYLRQALNGDVGGIRDLTVERDLIVRRDLIVDRHLRVGETIWAEDDITANRDLFAGRNLNVGEDLIIARDLSVGREAYFHGENTFDMGSGAFVQLNPYPTGAYFHCPLVIDNYDPWIRRADLHCENDIFTGGGIHTQGTCRFEDVWYGNSIEFSRTRGVYCEARFTIDGNDMYVNAALHCSETIYTDALVVNEIMPPWSRHNVTISRGDLIVNDSCHVYGEIDVSGYSEFGDVHSRGVLSSANGWLPSRPSANADQWNTGRGMNWSSATAAVPNPGPWTVIGFNDTGSGGYAHQMAFQISGSTGTLMYVRSRSQSGVWNPWRQISGIA